MLFIFFARFPVGSGKIRENDTIPRVKNMSYREKAARLAAFSRRPIPKRGNLRKN